MTKFEERLPVFRKELVDLCKKHHVEIVSVLLQTPSAILSQIHFVDIDNPEMMKKYGLEKTPTDDTPSLLVN